MYTSIPNGKIDDTKTCYLCTNYVVELRGRTGAGLGEPANATGTTDEDGE